MQVGCTKWSWHRNCTCPIALRSRSTPPLTPSRSIGWNRAVALNPGGPQHRRLRGLLTRSLNSTAVYEYCPLQEESAQRLVQLLLESPEDFVQHIRNTVGKSIVDISYGHNVEVRGRDYIEEYVHEAFMLSAKPFAFLVDFLPFRA
jgi:hypothetical protein